MAIKMGIVVLLLTILSSCYGVPPTKDAMVFMKGGVLSKTADGIIESGSVRVKSFWMAKYDVTNAQWKPFWKWYFSKNKEDFSSNFYDFGNMVLSSQDTVKQDSPDPDMPVIGMSEWDAMWFANWLSEKDGLVPVYTFKDWRKPDFQVIANRNANGYRFPTVVEWLYAYEEEGHKTTKYPGSNNLDEVATYWQTPHGDSTKISPVGTMEPSKQGIYDLLGNVYQWCWDIYSPSGLYQDWNPGKDAGSGIRLNPKICSSERLHWLNCDVDSYKKALKTARAYAGLKFFRKIPHPVIQAGDSLDAWYVGIRLVRNAD